MILGLVEDIYAAAVDPALWPTFLDNLSRVLSDSRASFSLIDYDGEAVKQQLFATGNFDKQHLTDYARHYDAINPWIPNVLRFSVGEVFRSDAMVTTSNLRKLEFHADWLRPQHLDEASAVVLQRDHNRQLAMTVLHPERPDDWRQEMERLLRILIPHMRRAAALNRQIGEAADSKGLLDSLLSRINNAAFLIDANGAVVMMNKEAERIVAANDGLTVHSGRLAARSRSVNLRLQYLIAEARKIGAGKDMAPDAALAVSRQSDFPSYGVLVCPLNAAILDDARAGLVLVIANDPNKSMGSADTDIMRQLHDLTAAEARLAKLLAEGMTLKEAADRLGITSNTARWSLKQIFAKTGVNRQSELIRLLVGQIGTVRLRTKSVLED